MEISIESLLAKVESLLAWSLKACSFIKNRLQELFSCGIPATACESKPLRCIVFIKEWLILLLTAKFHLIIIYYFITHDLILQSSEIFSPAIVPITILENDKNHHHVML